MTECTHYGEFDVRPFGAAGDGVADDTAAFRAAIAEAAKCEGTVLVPPGRYLVGELQLAPRIELRGVANFNYRRSAGSVLQLHPEAKDAKCLLNLTGAYGCHVRGICLVGQGAGHQTQGPVHGILIDKPDYGKEEDTPCIDTCRVERFSGDGIRLNRIWCFSVRHSHCIGNGGSGIRIRGWDGFILDNWLSGNNGAGYYACEENASVTMTGNRIEWNAQGGIRISGANKYNITGNYIDRSGNCAIDIQNSRDFTITGNVLYRSGRPEWTENPENSCHFRMQNCTGVTFTGNNLSAGRDDGGKGQLSPRTGILIGKAENCVVSLNTLNSCALEKMVILKDQQTNCIIRDNPGSLQK